MLIDVGPKADGGIPENQLAALRDLGKWLTKNGEGIFDSSPWKRPIQKLGDEKEIQFTQKDKSLYVYFLTSPKNKAIAIPDLILAKGAKAILVGPKNEELRLVRIGDKVQFQLPETLAYTTAFMVKISGLVD